MNELLYNINIIYMDKEVGSLACAYAYTLAQYCPKSHKILIIQPLHRL